MITVLQHAVVKESFRISKVKIVSTGFSRHQRGGSTILKLLKRGAGDEREALEIGKTLGTRLEKPKWGMMGTCAERERGDMGSGGGHGVVLFLPFLTLLLFPLSIFLSMSVVHIKMH